MNEFTNNHLGRVSTALIVVGIVLCIVLNVVRTRIGLDFTDEVFPIAVSKHLAQGSMLFTDELLIHQTSVAYTNPLYKLYLTFRPDGSAVVIYFRIVQLILILGAVALFAYSIRGPLSWPQGLLFTLPILSFSPVSYVGLNYLTLAFLSLICASAFLFRSQSFGGRLNSSLAGLFLGILAGCYPSAITAAVFAIVGSFASKARKGLESAFLFLGFLLGLIPILVYVLQAGYSTVWDVLSFNINSMYQFLSIDRTLGVLLNAIREPMAIPSVLLGIVWGKKLGSQDKKWKVIGTLLTIFFWASLLDKDYDVQHDRIVFAYSVFLISAYGIATFGKLPKNWILAAFLLGVAAVFAFSSASMGILAATPALLILATLIMINVQTKNKAVQLKLLVSPAAIAILTAAIQISKFLFFYDPLFAERLVPVHRGAYKYIYTYSTKFQYLDSIMVYLQKIPSSNSIFVYYAFPGGYLLSPARVQAPSVWIDSGRHRTQLMADKIETYFRKNGWPDYVLEMQYIRGKWPIPYSVKPLANDPIFQRLNSQAYNLVTESPIFRVYSNSN